MTKQKMGTRDQTAAALGDTAHAVASFTPNSACLALGPQLGFFLPKLCSVSSVQKHLTLSYVKLDNSFFSQSI